MHNTTNTRADYPHINVKIFLANRTRAHGHTLHIYYMRGNIMGVTVDQPIYPVGIEVESRCNSRTTVAVEVNNWYIAQLTTLKRVLEMEIFYHEPR